MVQKIILTLSVCAGIVLSPFGAKADKTKPKGKEVVTVYIGAKAKTGSGLGGEKDWIQWGNACIDGAGICIKTYSATEGTSNKAVLEAVSATQLKLVVTDQDLINSISTMIVDGQLVLQEEIQLPLAITNNYAELTTDVYYGINVGSYTLSIDNGTLEITFNLTRYEN
jgi:hypothetical protein